MLSHHQAVNCNHKFQFFKLCDGSYLYNIYSVHGGWMQRNISGHQPCQNWKNVQSFVVAAEISFYTGVRDRPRTMYCNLYLCCIIRWTSLPVVYGTGYTSCCSVFMGCLLISPASRSITSKHCISWKRFHRISNVLIPLYKICRTSGLVLSSLCKR